MLLFGAFCLMPRTTDGAEEARSARRRLVFEVSRIVELRSGVHSFKPLGSVALPLPLAKLRRVGGATYVGCAFELSSAVGQTSAVKPRGKLTAVK